MIHLSCGHKVDDVEDGIGVSYHGEDCDAVMGFVKVIFYAEYCRSCADQLKEEQGSYRIDEPCP